MARKTYSEEFRRDAVDLYANTQGATVKQIAADPGPFARPGQGVGGQ